MICLRVCLLAACSTLAATASPAVAAPLVAVDFGGTLANSPLQPDMQGMWGTNDPVTTATFGSYTVQLSADSSQTGTGANRSFIHKSGGRIDTTDAAIRDFYRDFYYDRSTVNGEGISLKISGLTPNTPYNLTLASFDADASAAVTTAENWGPKPGTDTSGASTTINMIRTPTPTSLWGAPYAGTIQVSTSSGTLDVLGTTSTANGRGAVLNGFKLNDGVNDVLQVDLGLGAENGSVQSGFAGMIGPETTTTPQSIVSNGYTVSVEGVGGGPFDVGFWNEGFSGQVLPPATHALYRDYFYNNSASEGEGVLLGIDGVTPNTDYDLKIWSYDPANPTATQTSWSPVNNTTGQTGVVTNINTPVPQVINDANHFTTIRVRSSDTKLEVFGTTTSGTGGTRLNAIELNAVIAQLPGDFNHDGVVNNSDLTVWQASIGHDATGDADNDGDSDGADFMIWQQNLGQPAVAAVPEPAAASLTVLACLMTAVWGRGRRLRS
jgi:hypothetical protein